MGQHFFTVTLLESFKTWLKIVSCNLDCASCLTYARCKTVNAFSLGMSLGTKLFKRKYVSIYLV